MLRYAGGNFVLRSGLLVLHEDEEREFERKRYDPGVVGTRRSSEARFGLPTYVDKVRSRCGTQTRRGVPLRPAPSPKVEGLIACQIWWAPGTGACRGSACLAEVVS